MIDGTDFGNRMCEYRRSIVEEVGSFFFFLHIISQLIWLHYKSDHSQSFLIQSKTTSKHFKNTSKKTKMN